MRREEGGKTGQNSVLDRIQKHMTSLKEKEPLVYKDVRDVKRELSKALRPTEQKKALATAIKRKIGRPRIDEKFKAKDVRITLKADLFEAVEKRRQKTKSRSGALCDLLEKGLQYEELRCLQADTLKIYLKEFAKIFSTLKINRPSSLWRTSEIFFEDNETTLSKLYKKSLQIRHYLSASHINLDNFSEIHKFLTKKEIRHLAFSSVPEKIAGVVTTRESKKREISP